MKRRSLWRKVERAVRAGLRDLLAGTSNPLHGVDQGLAAAEAALEDARRRLTWAEHTRATLRQQAEEREAEAARLDAEAQRVVAGDERRARACLVRAASAQAEAGAIRRHAEAAGDQEAQSRGVAEALEGRIAELHGRRQAILEDAVAASTDRAASRASAATMRAGAAMREAEDRSDARLARAEAGAEVAAVRDAVEEARLFAQVEWRLAQLRAQGGGQDRASRG